MIHNAIFNHGKQTVWLMVWPTDHRLRKNEFDLKVNSKNEINTDDLLLVNSDRTRNKYYKVSKVIDSRKSTIAGMTYYTLKATETKELISSL